MLDLHNNRQQHLYGFIKDLEFPVDVVPPLDKSRDISFEGDDYGVGLVFGVGGERSQGQPLDRLEGVLQLIDEPDGRNEDVGDGLLNLIHKFDVVSVRSVFVDEIVKNFPD